MARIKKEMETALQEKEKVAAKAQKKAAKLGDQSGEFGSPGGSSPEKSKTKEKRLRAMQTLSNLRALAAPQQASVEPAHAKPRGGFAAMTAVKTASKHFGAFTPQATTAELNSPQKLMARAQLAEMELAKALKREKMLIMQLQSDAAKANRWGQVRGAANMMRAWKCEKCKSSPCACPFFKGEISIVSGSHLPKSDLFGRCDAYCKVFYSGALLYTTKVCKNTYEPVWNATIPIAVQKMEVCRGLHLQVFDRDVSLFDHTDDFLGEVVLSANEMRALLQKSKNAGSSALPLNRIKNVIGHDKVESTVELNVVPDVLTDTAFKGKITVVSANSLPKSDVFGSCAAFVQVICGESIILTTEVVENSYHPSWNASFSFNHDRDECGGLRLRVVDRDKGIGNIYDAIGQVVLSGAQVWELLQNSQTDGSSTHKLQIEYPVIGHDKHESIIHIEVKADVLTDPDAKNEERSLPPNYNVELHIARNSMFKCDQTPAMRGPYASVGYSGGFSHKEHTRQRRNIFSFKNLSMIASAKTIERQKAQDKSIHSASEEEHPAKTRASSDSDLHSKSQTFPPIRGWRNPSTKIVLSNPFSWMFQPKERAQDSS